MNTPSHPAGSRRLSVTLLVSVFVLYGTVGFLLYRGRCISHWPFCNSDLVIFAVPFLSAFVANGFFLFSSAWLRPRSVARQATLLFASFALAFLSFWIYMIFAVNTYGE
ncbi:MAG: hypothetical protein NTZ16_00540 [Verrucomicrobia bacterium]|nr:hypothetical protein [Verrucomicrobiota bacterium]